MDFTLSQSQLNISDDTDNNKSANLKTNYLKLVQQ